MSQDRPGLVRMQRKLYLIAALAGDRTVYLAKYNPNVFGNWNQAIRFSTKANANYALKSIPDGGLVVPETDNKDSEIAKRLIAMRKKNPNPNNQLTVAITTFIRKLDTANRDQLADSIEMLKFMSSDMAMNPTTRKISKDILPILRSELKGFAPRKKNPAALKKNPATEIRELILFAENHEPLSNQFYSIMKNLEKKAKKGTYDPVLAAKLWKYWIDNAVKEYNYEFLTRKRSLVQNVFSVQDRKNAAIEVEAQWRSDVMRGDNPAARKKDPASPWIIFVYSGDLDVILFYAPSQEWFKWNHDKAKAARYATKAKADIALSKAYKPAKNVQYGLTKLNATEKEIRDAISSRHSSAGKA